MPEPEGNSSCQPISESPYQSDHMLNGKKNASGAELPFTSGRSTIHSTFVPVKKGHS